MVRVVVTGIGMATPNGLTTQENWDNQLAGKNVITRIHQFDPSRHKVQIAGQIDPDFWANPRGYLPKSWVGKPETNIHKDIRRMHRVTQLGVRVAIEAMTQSGLQITDANRKRVGVYVGTGGGGANEYIDGVNTLEKEGPDRVDPLISVRVMPNATAGMISKIMGAQGPSLTVTAACATGNEALRLAHHEIERGRCDAMVVVGSEAALDPIVIAAFGNLRALTSDFNDHPELASRPFDRGHSGFVWSDGAIGLVLESEESARSRGAGPLGYIISGYATDDAHHEVQPLDNAMGIQDAIRGALDEAKINKEEVGLISAHGTSTPENDPKETIAIYGVFGVELGSSIPVDPTKSRGGHMIGASGLFGVANSLLELRYGVVLPAYNYDDPDPACGLNVSREPRELKKARYAIINNAGFGGHNSCIVVGAI